MPGGNGSRRFRLPSLSVTIAWRLPSRVQPRVPLRGLPPGFLQLSRIVRPLVTLPSYRCGASQTANTPRFGPVCAFVWCSVSMCSHPFGGDSFIAEAEFLPTRAACTAHGTRVMALTLERTCPALDLARAPSPPRSHRLPLNGGSLSPLDGPPATAQPRLLQPVFARGCRVVRPVRREKQRRGRPPFRGGSFREAQEGRAIRRRSRTASRPPEPPRGWPRSRARLPVPLQGQFVLLAAGLPPRLLPGEKSTGSTWSILLQVAASAVRSRAVTGCDVPGFSRAPRVALACAPASRATLEDSLSLSRQHIERGFNRCRASCGPRCRGDHRHRVRLSRRGGGGGNPRVFAAVVTRSSEIGCDRSGDR